MYVLPVIFFCYKNYCADTRVLYIFLLHKKTPALPFGKREPLNKL